jgi:hypothetical protein
MTPIEKYKQELKIKLQFEKTLSNSVLSVFVVMTRDLKKNLQNGALIDVNDYRPLFLKIMLKYSLKVSKEFKRSYREAKEEEDDEIDKAIALFLASFLDNQLFYINKTTEAQIREMYYTSQQELLEAGTPITNEATAQKVSEKFIKSGKARSNVIATEVVNTVAEKSKAIEMEVLIKNNPSLFEYVEKIWITVLDGRERDTHHAANSQRVNYNDPFHIGDSLMMFPRDSSMGASLKEIINCRCGCIYI